MDPNKIKAWGAAMLTIGAVIAGGFKVVDARAQDAAMATAKQEVEQRMQPVEQKLETLVEQGNERRLADRRREDREESAWCLDREHQDLTKEARDRICTAESEARWEEWAREDKARPAGDP